MIDRSIVKLDDHVVNQIKAGEVIDRPYNIVKELVENSLDAGATWVSVEILDGGKALIQVADNGCGVVKNQLVLALERHATSKLSSFEDLSSLNSFGFRGEALPSIAAVSHFTLRSKHIHSTEDFGYEVVMAHGKLAPLKPVSMDVGTVVQVRELFQQVPVRLKFLRSTGTEFSHIHTFLLAMAFCYPKVSFQFTHNGKKIFNHQPKAVLQDRFTDLLSVESQQYVPVFFQRGGFVLEGFVLHTDYIRGLQPSHFVTLVNHRYVKDKVVRAGLLQGYQGLLMKGMMPGCFLKVSIDPSWCDVNVHPSKIEVRFKDPMSLQELIAMGVEDGLKSALKTKYNLGSPPVQTQQDQERPKEERHFAEQKTQFPFSAARSFVETPKFVQTARLKTEELAPQLNWEQKPQGHPKKESAEKESVEKENLNTESFSYLGQFGRCYLMLERDGELWVVDQHAFHERILFEEILSYYKKNGSMAAQGLVIPLFVRVDKKFVFLARDYNEQLKKLGFDVEITKEEEPLVLCSHPALIPLERAEEVFLGILERLKTHGGLGEEVGESVQISSVFHDVFATMACHSAIRSGDALNEELARRLMDRAHNVDFFAHCPHGRPVVRKFSRKDLDTWFQRI